jgi:hypothetical protein
MSSTQAPSYAQEGPLATCQVVWDPRFPCGQHHCKKQSPGAESAPPAPHRLLRARRSPASVLAPRSRVCSTKAPYVHHTHGPTSSSQGTSRPLPCGGCRVSVALLFALIAALLPPLCAPYRIVAVPVPAPGPGPGADTEPEAAGSTPSPSVHVFLIHNHKARPIPHQQTWESLGYSIPNPDSNPIPAPAPAPAPATASTTASTTDAGPGPCVSELAYGGEVLSWRHAGECVCVCVCVCVHLSLHHSH